MAIWDAAGRTKIFEIILRIDTDKYSAACNLK